MPSDPSPPRSVFFPSPEDVTIINSSVTNALPDRQSERDVRVGRQCELVEVGARVTPPLSAPTGGVLGGTTEMPDEIGSDLSDALRRALHRVLCSHPGQLGSVYLAMIRKPMASPAELEPLTSCANAGAVGNLRSTILALTDGIVSDGPSRVQQSKGALRSIGRSTTDGLVRRRIDEVLAVLDRKVGQPRLVDRSEQDPHPGPLMGSEGTEGVCVSTYPHYWMRARASDRGKRLLRVGAGSRARLLEEARRSDAPEVPLLLRVYSTPHPAWMVQKFHRMLVAAGHEREADASPRAGWFVTDLEFCDALAEVLELDIICDEPQT